MNQKCKICGSTSEKMFSAQVLRKYDVSYYQCAHCEFIQTEEPYWLEEAYNSAINVSDTGIIHRNEIFRRISSSLFYFCFKPKAKFLDFAGGYGIFTRMMRDVGFDYYWTDVYAQNLVARGFEHSTNTTYEAVTAFEVFEHMINPLADIETMLKYSKAIVFSTEILPEPIRQKSWWYYAFEHGQHIAFYSKKTLNEIAKKYNLNLLTNEKNFHVFSRKKINPLLFTLLYKASKYGLYAWVTFWMKSRKNSDNLLLKNYASSNR